jgi:hypothetical protein
VAWIVLHCFIGLEFFPLFLMHIQVFTSKSILILYIFGLKSLSLSFHFLYLPISLFSLTYIVSVVF